MDGVFLEIVKIVVVFTVLNLFINHFLNKLRSDSEKEENLKLVERVKESIHVVEVETHQGIEYWYDKDSGTFLAQGNSIGEAIEHAKFRYPNHVFVLLDKEENIAGIICEATDWKPDPDYGKDGKEIRFKL